MCGICGINTTLSTEDTPAIVSRMSQALTHRGPDDAGQHSRRQCSLAMRRLAIIDLAGGQQPIFSEDERLVIVFNGEIYNFQVLRTMLQKRGHHFQTQTDTEVIVHLYEDEAEKAPQFLNGMFAFCIHDQIDNSLFIARDRFGEKPLYYYCDPQNGFAFSSEIKSLLECPFVPRRLDYEALGYYMRVGYVPAPLTMFKDIHILPPGHWLKWRDGQLTVQPYFHIDYRPDPTLAREEAAGEAVQEALKQAVSRQAISDVPLGAFLSGGIDSSAVVATLQSTTNRPVKTFTMRFEEDSYDEGEIARQVAAHLGTDHHEFVVPNVSFQTDDFCRIVEHVGLPFLDTSAIPTYILSKQIRQVVTVALSGDGGDEMFAGYPFFRWGLTIRQTQKLPPSLIRAGANLSNWLSRQPGLSQVGRLRRIRRGLQGATYPAHLLPIMVHSVFEPTELTPLLRCPKVLAVANSDLPRFSRLPEEAKAWSPLRQLMYYRLKHTLPDRMLTKIDRMSMAASIEVRAPMLDPDLAELSMRLPDHHLLNRGVGKSILRKTVRGKVPEIVFTHPKRGFDIPLHRFQNEQYRHMAQDLLLRNDGIMQLFAPNAMTNILNTGLNQQANRADRSVYRASHQLWGLMQLSAWQQRFEVSV